MTIGVIFVEQSAMKEKCKDRDVRFDERPGVVMDGVLAKTKGQKKE